MRLAWLVVGLAVGGLVAACSASQPGDGAERRGEQSEAGLVELTWSEPIEVAGGPAYRGPWRANDSEFHFVDDPTVAIDDGGRIAVVWANQVDQDVFIQAYDAAGEAVLDMPVNVSSSPDTFSWLPRVAIPVGDPRRVYVLWQEIVFSGGSHGGEIFFARSTDGGRSFETPVNLSGTTAGDGKGRLSVDRWDNGSLDLAVGPGWRDPCCLDRIRGRLVVPPLHRRWTDLRQAFADRRGGDATGPRAVARRRAGWSRPSGVERRRGSGGGRPLRHIDRRRCQLRRADPCHQQRRPRRRPETCRRRPRDRPRRLRRGAPTSPRADTTSCTAVGLPVLGRSKSPG